MAETKKENNNIEIRTGCTLLDLVVGGGTMMGFPAGKIINLVGDKSSGKTFLACEIVAKNFHHYKNKFVFNYDDGEDGFTFDTKSLYGMDMIKDDTLRSKTIENFDTNSTKFLNKMKQDQIGLYILDTLDGLSNTDIEKRSDERFKAAEKGKELEKGTYGMLTPKFLSQEYFKVQTSKLSDTATSLIIISQVRENIDAGMWGAKFTRSGGKALDFYAHTCLWLATVRKITKKDRVIGVVISAITKKSKTPRPFRECTFSVYFDYGIDNIGSNIDFLYDLLAKDGSFKEGANNIIWDDEKKKMNLENFKAFLEKKGILIELRKQKKHETGDGQLSIKWLMEWLEKQPEEMKKELENGFGAGISRDELIKKIENDPEMEKELEKRVIDKWESIENSIKIDRKRKYS